MNHLLKRLIFILSLMLFFLYALPVFAQPSLQVQTLSQNYKTNGLVTLKIQLSNNEKEPVSGEVRITNSNPYLSMPPHIIKVEGLTDTKTWTIKVPQMYFEGKVYASFFQEGKKTATTIANYNVLKEYPNISILYLVSKGNEVPNFLYNNASSQKNNIKEYTELQKADNKKEYDFFVYDLIVLEDLELLTLSEKEWQDLKRWVESGGTLVVPGGNYTLIPEELRPAKTIDTKTLQFLPELEQDMGVNLPRESEMNIQVNEPLSAAEVKYKADGINWIISKNYGFGKIIAIPVSFKDATFVNWQGSNRFWHNIRQLVIEDNPSYGYDNPAGWNGEFTGVLQSLLPTQMPSTLSLVILFILYALIVGFGSYFVLRAKDKRGLMWLTVPTFAMIFFTAIYFYGASQRASQVIVAESGRITLYKDYSKTEAGIGVFVPSMGDYKLTLPGNFAVTTPYEIKNNAQIEFQNNSVTTTFKDMPVWSMKTVHTSLDQQPKGNLQINHLKVNGSEVSFQITNNTIYDLEGIIIGANDFAYYEIPQLKKGQKVNINFNLQKQKSIYEYMRFDNVEKKDRQLANMKVNLMVNTFQGYKGLSQRGLYIAGFTGEEKINVAVNDRKQSDIVSLFLVRQQIEGIKPVNLEERLVK